MNLLYLISQDVNNHYDTYDSAVVCAPDEETARRMDPRTGEPANFQEEWTDWAYKLEQVKVKFLGIARPDLPLGVVCSSFNAG